MVGHSEGGAVALMAAAKDKRIAAVGAHGDARRQRQRTWSWRSRSGCSTARSCRTPTSRRGSTCRRQIHEAVITGKGWKRCRRTSAGRSTTPSSRASSRIDPAKVMPRVRQPMLIVQGGLDTQVEPSNADRLEALARERKGAAPVEVVKIPASTICSFRRRPAKSTSTPTLKDKQISPAVAPAIVAWLQKTLPAPSR